MRKMAMGTAAVFLTGTLAGLALAGADGAAVYKKCSSCHTSTGSGISGHFPPLAGNAVRLVKADRDYPVKAVLFGMKGEIEVEGKRYKGVMPAFENQLSDEEIAAVLDYVLSSWGNDKLLPKGFKKYTAAEVKALRGKKLSRDQVLETREKLKLK